MVSEFDHYWHVMGKTMRHEECTFWIKHWNNYLNMRGAEALPRCSWIFIHGCMLLICFVICNIIRLLWVWVVAHCVEIYHVLGVYTDLAALTSAPKSVAGARPHFSSSADDVDDHVNQWLPFTCSHSYHVYEAYSSRCGLAWNVHPLLCPSIPFQDASWNSTPF